MYDSKKKQGYSATIYDANCVTMENGTALIAKQNYSEFVKQYLKYNQRKDVYKRQGIY